MPNNPIGNGTRIRKKSGKVMINGGYWEERHFPQQMIMGGYWNTPYQTSQGHSAAPYGQGSRYDPSAVRETPGRT